MSLWVSQAFSSCALPISVQPSDSAAHSHTIQVSGRRGWCYTSHFKRSELFITSDLNFFVFFLMAIERGVQHTKVCSVWLPYAKVTRV